MNTKVLKLEPGGRLATFKPGVFRLLSKVTIIIDDDGGARLMIWPLNSPKAKRPVAVIGITQKQAINLAELILALAGTREYIGGA